MRLSNHWEHPPTTHPPTGTQNYMIEQKESKTQKTKDISLYEETPKQLNLTPTTKKCPLGPQKVKNYTKINSKSKLRIEGTVENKRY